MPQTLIETAQISPPLAVIRGEEVTAATQHRFRHVDRRLPTLMECLVTIYGFRDGAQAFILTEVGDNPGPSVTNCIETLMPAVFNELGGSSLEKVRFFEHYRSDLSYQRIDPQFWETWDELTFSIAGSCIQFTGWRPVARHPEKRLAVG